MARKLRQQIENQAAQIAKMRDDLASIRTEAHRIKRCRLTRTAREALRRIFRITGYIPIERIGEILKSVYAPAIIEQQNLASIIHRRFEK